MKFRIYAERRVFYIGEVEADSHDEARELANMTHVEWEVDHMGGRGLGSDDYTVIDVEAIEDEDEEEEDDDDES